MDVKIKVEDTEVIEILDSEEEEEDIKPFSSQSKKHKLDLEEEEIKPCGSHSKKYKLDLDPNENYVPSSPKKVKKEIKPQLKEPRKQAATKEKKPNSKGQINDATQRLYEAAQGSAEGTFDIQQGESINVMDLERMDWDESEFVAKLEQIEIHIARNVMQLLDEDNTIPFIARYRKELTNDMSPEKLREVKAAYNMVKSVKQKAATVMKAIAKLGKLTPFVEKAIRCAHSINELDRIYAPFKPSGKRKLAKRARQLGLDESANSILTGSRIVKIEQLVKPEKNGLDNLEDVELGLKHIIADVISRDRHVLDSLRSTKVDNRIRLESSKAPPAKKSKTSKQNEKAKEKTNVNRAFHKGYKDRVDNKNEFKSYFNFCMPIKRIKPYQVLAINRGENLKVLSVKLIIPDFVLNRLKNFCHGRWLSRGHKYPVRSRMVDFSIEDSYTRFIQPLLIRQIRAELTQKAEHAVIEVCAMNLKKLLLSPPFRGKVVLGIDPSFHNGCRIGITSPTGTVLATDVIYPQYGEKVCPDSDPNALKLKDLLKNYNCDVIALGNGTACRETESYLSELIQSGWFQPLDVKYTVVSEQGASIYSCSSIAQKEFPGTDPNVISAVSLARRLQDPLGELVKEEPKYLNLGMYGRDVPEKKLSSALDEIVEECVSFVGVDINVASHCLLRRIAGLNSRRADKIIEWRRSNGLFTNRQQLLKVKGVSAKTFEQCAGFVRVIPETAKTNSYKFFGSSKPKEMKKSDDSENPLDRTWIHPESYSVALRFINKCELSLDDLGKPYFIRKVEDTATRIGIKNIAEEFGVTETLIKLISEGLQQSPDHDLRSQFQEPLFHRGVTSLEELQIGVILTGQAQNVTHSGTFVDIGVGQDGLIPQSLLRDMRPQLGDRIEVKVLAVNLKRRRITLDLLRIL